MSALERSVDSAQVKAGLVLPTGQEVLVHLLARKAGGFHVRVRVCSSADGAGVAGRRVRIVDPASGATVGSAETGADGLVDAPVPEEKAYDVFLDDGGSEAAGGTFAPEDDLHAFVFVELRDGSGPLRDETVTLTAADGSVQQVTTDADGCLQAEVAPGPCTVEVRGKALPAHSVFDDDGIPEEGAAYRFVLQ
jgi:hypothetical protein